jgi:hypothetical protein
VPDEHNNGKRASDVLFHTRHKKFVHLHPTSTFADDPVAACKSSELLCFSSLLETNKAYLVHVMPVAALHTLLLFGRRLDTTRACDRIVVDGWLELNLKSAEAGQQLLLISHQLRRLLRRV